LSTRIPAPRYLRIARWLAASIALLIVWGSLYPFDFFLPDEQLLHRRLFGALSHHMTRADMASNVLIYMPFGAVMMLALFGRSRLTHVLQTTVFGSLLSMNMELAQAFTPHRVTSVFDWLLNSAGAFAGAVMISLYLLVGKRWRFRSLIGPRPALVPMWLVLLWVVSQFAPYVPALNSAQLQASTDQLAHRYPWSVVQGSVAIAAWLALAEAMRRIWKPHHAAVALVGLIAATLFARLWIVNQHLRYEEAIAWLVALGSLFSSRPQDSRARTGIAAGACAVALLLAGLWPFEFAAEAGPFYWTPFSGNLLLSRDYQPLLEKIFIYAALLWTLTLCIGRLSVAFMAAFALTTLVELQQMWMPDRRAEITDPLLIALLTAVFYIALEFQPYALGNRGSRAAGAASRPGLRRLDDAGQPK